MTSEGARTREEVERLARSLGLTRLSPAQLEELARAQGYARGLSERLPREYALSEEPCNIFVAGPAGEEGRGQ